MVKLKIKSTGVDIEVVVNKLTLIIKNNYIFLIFFIHYIISIYILEYR